MGDEIDMYVPSFPRLHDSGISVILLARLGAQIQRDRRVTTQIRLDLLPLFLLPRVQISPALQSGDATRNTNPARSVLHCADPAGAAAFVSSSSRADQSGVGFGKKWAEQKIAAAMSNPKKMQRKWAD
ncbi:Uncharacterized protein Fot_38223 [Forsythia ovata]|uniref:Uncharacterized protein n=1 Tax=Forsythia ovata TaxID=205694 RepID=A0ABD1S173_9LAMI